MQAFIEATQGELKSLCRRHHVRRLELFGSAAESALDPNASDLDFLVEFEDLDPPAFADAYFGLQEALRSAARPKALGTGIVPSVY